MTSAPPFTLHGAADLGDPSLRQALAVMVRRKVPRRDVEDVVQSVLVDAVASGTAPTEPVRFRKWLWGIVRNKIADYHRAMGREAPGELPELEAAPSPIAARDWARWAERELPDSPLARQTLEWLLREGDGEKLESIATEANLPADRVRQRVSRLRQHFRARWDTQAAALASLLVGAALAAFLGWLWRKQQPAPSPLIVHEAPVAPREGPEPAPAVAIELRRAALDACEARQWQACVEGLDRARTLDPVGDQAPAITEARRAAAAAMSPQAPLVPVPSAAPGPPLAPTAPPAPSASSPPPSGQLDSLGSDPGKAVASRKSGVTPIVPPNGKPAKANKGSSMDGPPAPGREKLAPSKAIDF